MSAFSRDHLTKLRSRNITGVVRLATSASCLSVFALAEAQAPPERDLEEVIVTAQKRAERLQDVPISMSVLGGAELDKSTAEGVTEALSSVPGITTSVSFQGGGTQVAVRGVTAGGPLFNGSSPIAYYIDSVPFGLVKTAIAPDSNAYDLERIEVLRGPQGTLYGASAQNGVVRILTRDAQPDDFEFKARTSASSTAEGGENFRGDMALNMPIVPGKFAARAVLGYEDLSGWIDRPTQKNANDAELQSMRLKLNAQPTEQLAIGLSAWLSRADYGAPSFSDDQLRHSSSADESIETDCNIYALKIDYDFTSFSVVGTTSYLEYANAGDVDLFPLVGVPVPLFTGLESEVVSQEVIFSSTTDGAWRWSVGGMYRDAEDRLVQTLLFLPAPIDFSDTSESFAVFGEVTRVFLDGKLELTAGLRHFEDDVTQSENVRNTGVPTEALFRATSKFDADSPRLVLTWLPSDHLTIYGSYAEGFRSGFNQNANVIVAAPNFEPLDADNLKNYEVGVKGSLWDRRVTYDTAVYYIDWQDVQQTLTVNIGGAPVTALVNGESASGAGFEFGVTTQLVEGLVFGVNFGWNDLTMDSVVISDGVALFDKGDRLSVSPEYTAGASLAYAFPLGRGGYEGEFSTSANFSSEQSQRAIAAGARRIDTGEDQLIARASFSLNAPDHWVATLFIDNISDEQDAALRSPTGVPQWGTRVRPRTTGLQLEYRF